MSNLIHARSLGTCIERTSESLTQNLGVTVVLEKQEHSLSYATSFLALLWRLKTSQALAIIESSLLNVKC